MVVIVMQKKYLSYIVIAFIILIFIALLLTAHYFLHQPTGADARLTHPVIAVDFNNNNVLNQDELLKGQDAILAVRKIDNRTQKVSDELFHSIAILERLDLNEDGRLNKDDAVFPSLELIFLTDGGKNRKHMTLTEAGIVAIVFNKKSVGKVHEIFKGSDNLIGYALKKDGTRLEIRAIPVAFS